MSTTALPPIPVRCPCCAHITVPGGKVWWQFHCVSKGKVRHCRWVTCTKCRARMDTMTGQHITKEPGDTHAKGCSHV